MGGPMGGGSINGGLMNGPPGPGPMGGPPGSLHMQAMRLFQGSAPDPTGSYGGFFQTKKVGLLFLLTSSFLVGTLQMIRSTIFRSEQQTAHTTLRIAAVKNAHFWIHCDVWHLLAFVADIF